MLQDMMDIIGAAWPLQALKDAPIRSFSAAGMAFEARAFDAVGLGRVSTMTAEGMGGKMRMVSLIINPFELDAPIFSCDRVGAMGQEALMIEMYDSLLSDGFCADGMLEPAGRFPEREDAPAAHWYDALRVPPNVFRKGGPEDAPGFDRLAIDFMGEYIAAARSAPACDAAAKRAKAAAYTEGLLAHGGPATDPVIAALGPEATAVLFRDVLFGTGEPPSHSANG